MEEFDYELYKKIRLDHYYEVDWIVNRLQNILHSVTVGTHFFPDKPIAVMVSIPLDLKWPLELNSSHRLWADMAAKLRPQIEAIDPNNKFEGLYKVITGCFQDYKPDPWPLYKPYYSNNMEGEIWFNDPVLEYALHNVSRWDSMHRLPEDLTEFMKDKKWPEKEY